MKVLIVDADKKETIENLLVNEIYFDKNIPFLRVKLSDGSFFDTKQFIYSIPKRKDSFDDIERFYKTAFLC